MQSQNVQFGCGTCAPASWLNFDAGPAFLLQKRFRFLKPVLVRRGFPDYPANIRYGDVIKGLPVPMSSAERVYSSHVLEHLSLEDCRRALRNVWRTLAPGGVFRFVVPDLEFYIHKYLASEDAEAASTFMSEALLGERSSERGVRSVPKMLFGRSQHLWMWDYKNFEKELVDAGFVQVRRAQFGDSGDEVFADVESAHRWINCLGLECRRPA